MPKWYFSKEGLLRTPSRLDGIDFMTEQRYRREGARFIMDCGNKMKLYPFRLSFLFDYERNNSSSCQIKLRSIFSGKNAVLFCNLLLFICQASRFKMFCIFNLVLRSLVIVAICSLLTDVLLCQH